MYKFVFWFSLMIFNKLIVSLSLVFFHYVSMFCWIKSKQCIFLNLFLTACLFPPHLIHNSLSIIRKVFFIFILVLFLPPTFYIWFFFFCGLSEVTFEIHLAQFIYFNLTFEMYLIDLKSLIIIIKSSGQLHFKVQASKYKFLLIYEFMTHD